MKKHLFSMSICILSLGIMLWCCKKKPTSPPPSPEAKLVLNPFECGKGGFDGERFYLLKADGNKDYETYQHTPKTKEELIALLEKKTPLGTINTYFITNMDSLFMKQDNYDFSGIENWITCNVTTMKFLFATPVATTTQKEASSSSVEAASSSTSNFNGNISDWNVSRVRNMFGMFQNCAQFNQDLSKWDVGSVKNMGSMFYNCSTFNQDVSKWNVSRVTNMSSMFAGCAKFDQDISKWNVGSVKNMNYMFYNCSTFCQDLSAWNVEKVDSCRSVFSGATKMMGTNGTMCKKKPAKFQDSAKACKCEESKAKK